jgi:L-cysteate sulfo-lyase
VELARLPTPFEPMLRLSERLGGPRIFVKRDDETGLALGGNKLRKLEFLLGDALAQGADTIITAGAMQSNHARQTAAACARLGLRCELILRGKPRQSYPYLRSGNAMLDRLFGAHILVLEPDASREEAMERRAEELRAQGRKPYVVPVGGSCLVGCFGYALCAEEIVSQAADQGVFIDAIVLATSSCGTHAGLVAGLHAMRAASRVIGIAVESDRAAQEQRVFDLATQTAEALGASALPLEAVRVADDWVGPGYAEPSEEMRDAVKLAARTEGLVLDPVYTGKAMAGLIGLIAAGEFGREHNVVFLHTGGAPGLFGYPESLQLD